MSLLKKIKLWLFFKYLLNNIHYLLCICIFYFLNKNQLQEIILPCLHYNNIFYSTYDGLLQWSLLSASISLFYPEWKVPTTLRRAWLIDHANLFYYFLPEFTYYSVGVCSSFGIFYLKLLQRLHSFFFLFLLPIFTFSGRYLVWLYLNC